MAKYLLLKHYRGVPASVNDAPMEQWTSEELSTHVQYMDDFAARLEGTGEFVDAQALSPEGTFVARADTSRRHREVRVEGEPMPGPGEAVDDTLLLYFLCAHTSLTPASAVALMLRAVGGLTTHQIARAYLVPEASMALLIRWAMRTVSGVRFNQPGDAATVPSHVAPRARPAVGGDAFSDGGNPLT